MSAPDTQPAGAPPALPDPLRVAEVLAWLDACESPWSRFDTFTGIVHIGPYEYARPAGAAATVRALVLAAGAADRRRAGEP